MSACAAVHDHLAEIPQSQCPSISIIGHYGIWVRRDRKESYALGGLSTTLGTAWNTLQIIDIVGFLGIAWTPL
jgi:hypothetical protein